MTLSDKEEKMQKVTFEDALNMTGYGRYNMLMMLLTGSAIISMAFETMSVAYLVPASACELVTSSAAQGMMAGVPLFGVLISSNIWGYLADTKGRKKILQVSLILGFVTGAAATLSPNWIVFCFFKFLSSSAMAGTFGLAVTFLSECTPESSRSILIVLITSVYLSSTGIMAALTIPILPLTFSYHIPYLDIYFNSWRVLNIIYALPSLLAAIGSFLAYESPKYLLSIGEEQEALNVLRKIYMSNGGKNEDNYEVKSVILDEERGAQKTKGFWSSVAGQTLPLIKPPLLQKTVLISMLYVCAYICMQPFLVWIPYMVDGFMKSLEKGESGFTFCEMLRSSQNATVIHESTDCTLNKTAMIMVLAMELFLAALNGAMSGLLKFCSRKRMLITLQLVAAVACLCINLSSVWQLTAVLMIVYISSVLNFGLLSTFSVDVFPTYVKAMGVCLTLMMGRGSAVVGINLMKKLLDSSCESTFYIFGSITLFGGLIGFMLPEEKKKPGLKKCAET